ncbi:hypothetical protein GGS21DRAFT_491974 [Xylaria nigripes]|nr:hypothetical protein GGS21DRAFT_491974 [Xylaria nigripes]
MPRVIGRHTGTKLINTSHVSTSELNTTFGKATIFFVVRHSALKSTRYTSSVPTGTSLCQSAVIKLETEISTLPSLDAADREVINSLPEIKPSYDESAWMVKNHSTTNGTSQKETHKTVFSRKSPT